MPQTYNAAIIGCGRMGGSIDERSAHARVVDLMEEVRKTITEI